MPVLLLTHLGKYTWPSCAINSNTPQCVVFPVALLETLKSIGYSMCSDAATVQRKETAHTACMHAHLHAMINTSSDKGALLGPGVLHLVAELTKPVQSRGWQDDFVAIFC
jgi:hypothetical protein